MKKRKIKHTQTDKLSHKEMFNWFLVVLVLLATIVSITIYGHVNSRKIEEQRERELIKISNNTTHFFRNFVDNKLDWMRMFAKAVSISEQVDTQEWRKLLQREHSFYYQLGIADRSGQIYYGNQKQKNVSDKEYFKRAIKGEAYISRLQKSKLNENDSIILAVPIQNLRGGIDGVVAMEYSTRILGEYINDLDTEWEEYGANMIINRYGELIAPYSGMEECNNIFEIFYERRPEDKACLKQMKKDIKNNQSGIFHYYNQKNLRRTLYYQPLGINDWTMVSIGAMKENLATLQFIERINLLFSILFACIILLGTLATRNIYLCRTQRINNMKVDQLTNIYRREIGEGYVQSAFKDNSHNVFYGCLFLDIDDFKNVNDTYGHEKGDEILTALGDILLSSSQKNDIVYRYGGDEFCIWLFGNGDAKELLTIGHHILSKAEAQETIHLSIGATCINQSEHDMQAVLKRADAASYAAKKQGKNQIVLYENIKSVQGEAPFDITVSPERLS